MLLLGVFVVLAVGFVAAAEAADVVQLAPVTEFQQEKSLGFYELPGCDVEVECVALILSCADWQLEVTVTFIQHAELAEWLTANRQGDEPWQGDAMLVVGDRPFALHPVTMTFSDFSGLWEVTSAVTDRAGAAWDAITTLSDWRVWLSPHEFAFKVNDAGHHELRKLRRQCEAG